MKKGALITGGAERIGREIALSVAKIGYDIALHYNSSQDKAIQTREEIKLKNVSCEIFKADFNNVDEVSIMFKEIIKQFKISLLINSASFFAESSLTDNNFNNFDKCFNINFKAPYILTKLFANYYLSSDLFANTEETGIIINLLDAKIAKNKSINFDYLLSKKALKEFTEMSAVALAPKIRVNGIAPGIILPPKGKDMEYLTNLVKRIPLKKIGSVKNITDTIKFITFNDFISGQIIYVDGGEKL